VEIDMKDAEGRYPRPLRYVQHLQHTREDENVRQKGKESMSADETRQTAETSSPASGSEMGASGEFLGGGVPEGRDDSQIDAANAGRTGTGRLKTRRGKLIFEIGRSTRYCTYRAHFYAGQVDRTTALSLIGGSAVVADILGQFDFSWFASAGATVVVISSLCSLAFRWPEKARFWQDQRTRYALLDARFRRLGGRMTEEQLDQMRAEVAELEADGMEGKTHNVLMAICDNEERNRREISGRHKVWFWQRWFANMTDLPPVNWE
jgi:hypothetical protein